MSGQYLNELRAEIIERVPQAVRDMRDTSTIADALNVGRTRPTMREIGNGLVLETLGFGVGNAVLDIVASDEMLRHVRPLLRDGRLVASSQLVANWFDGLVAASIVTRDQADAVIALGYEPAPVSEVDVRRACWSDAGEWLA